MRFRTAVVSVVAIAALGAAVPAIAAGWNSTGNGTPAAKAGNVAVATGIGLNGSSTCQGGNGNHNANIPLQWTASATPGVSGYDVYLSGSSGSLGAKQNSSLITGTTTTVVDTTNGGHTTKWITVRTHFATNWIADSTQTSISVVGC